MIKYEIIGNRVIARLHNCQLSAMNYIMSEVTKAINGRDNDFLRAIPMDILKNWIRTYCRKRMIDTYMASAICSKDDKFDEETGKRIARARVLKKYYTSLNKTIGSILFALEDFTRAVNVMAERTNTREKVWKNQEHLELDRDYFTKVRNKSHRYYGQHNPYPIYPF